LSAKKKETKFFNVDSRLQLYVFFIVTTVGTVGILMDAPHIFEYVDQGPTPKRLFF